jgi:hypothetical protein
MAALSTTSSDPSVPFPNSRRQRAVRLGVGSLLILHALSRFPLVLDSFREDHTDTAGGGIVGIVLFLLFAIQTLRGRWLFATMCFLALSLLGEIWLILQLPETIADLSYRNLIFVVRWPSMLVQLISFAGICYLHYASAKCVPRSAPPAVQASASVPGK